MRFRASFVYCLGLLVLVSAFAASPAHAQMRGGVQGGISLDPDQAFFGGHLESTPLVDRLRFRPGVDIGFGDDITLIAFNFDFTYAFPGNRPWTPYVGAGPALNWFDNGGSSTDGGFNFLIGAKNRDGLFFEMRVGAIDSPDLKFGVGVTFR